MGKTVEEPRIHIVSFRVTDDEMDGLRETSKAFGMKLSDIARRRVVGSDCQRCSSCEGHA